MGKDAGATTRHDPHEPGQMPHYQKKNGGGGHIFYDGYLILPSDQDAVDMGNPFSWLKDLLDLLCPDNEEEEEEEDYNPWPVSA